MKKSAIHIAVVAAIGSCAAGYAQLGLAQQAAQQAAQRGLEEVIVTATRREANVQDLPMAVTAISSDALENQNIENAMDLTAVVPNVLLSGGGRGLANGQVRMRGIPNVGVYVDGVWQVSQTGLLQRQFVELDRVEVLRGPQGTLVGRDSTGGSIQLFTQAPAEEFGVTAKLGFGDFERRDASVSVDIPFTDTFQSRWTVASYQKEGYVKSVVTGFKTGGLENEVLRGDLLWTPIDRLRLRLIYQEDDQVATTARVQSFINPEVAYDFGWQVGISEAHDIASLAAGGVGFNCQSTVAGCPGGALDEFESRQLSTKPDTTNLEQTTFNLDYDINDALSVKYIFGDTLMRNSLWTDFGGAEFNFFINYDLTEVDLSSHEIQLNGQHDRVNWVVGAFTWDQKDNTRGVEWSHSDWTYARPAGVQQTLDFADVLASPTCAMTPADRGRDFSFIDENGVLQLDPNTLAGWPQPCAAAFSARFGTNFNSTNGFDGSDRAALAEQDGYAVFGEATFDISDRWDVTVGYRFHDQTNSDVDKDVMAGKLAGVTELRPVLLWTDFVDFDRAINAPLDEASRLSLDFDQGTARLATSYDVNDDTMVYFAYSEGFNSGGIDTYFDSLGCPAGDFCARVVNVFDPETIENTEIGLRSDLLDGRLRANVTLFDTRWIDIQATASVIDRADGQPITETTTQNSAKAYAKGIEVELNYALTDNLLLGANLGTLDTKYYDIIPGAQLTEETELGGAPEETYSLSAQYVWNFEGGANIMAHLQGNYWGKYWRSSIPSFREDAYGGTTRSGDFWTVNARLTYTPVEGNYEISLWGNNLNDAYNLNSGFMDSIWNFDFAGVDAPREVGLSMSMSF